ncbi:GNAT family N-acetyltransferase [Candidatus Leptofilum sp.]|uniref:GNAT family N-acetyltransferase n=1 Tax=Candidatus Leptofilum sp. TaxID=3241576 RepID=UPI003B5A4876
MSELEFHPVTVARWSHLEAFFKANGNPNYCWCMRWRLRSGDFGKENAAGRKRKFAALVEQDVPVGILAYHEGRVVGWCSISLRENFEGLERSRILKRVDEKPVWSVTCFFIARQFRGQGVASQLLSAAVDYARSRGAEIVEGYPVQPDKSYHFMGSPAAFQKVGFEEVAIASNGRKIVRKQINQD